MVLASLSLADLPAEHPVALYAAYHAARAESDGVILQKNFDPIDVPRIMPWMLILDRIEEKGRTEFFYRMAGTGCHMIFGIDYTGKILGDDLPPEAAAERRQEILDIIESKSPSLTRTSIPLEGRDFIDIIRGVFAVSHTGAGVDRLHIIIAPENARLTG